MISSLFKTFRSTSFFPLFFLTVPFCVEKFLTIYSFNQFQQEDLKKKRKKGKVTKMSEWDTSSEVKCYFFSLIFLGSGLS